MALDTYTGLLASLATVAVRDDLTAEWPIYVSLAEAAFNRELTAKAIRPMIARATTTIYGEYETVPSDLIRPVSFVLTSTDDPVHLQHVAPEDLARMAQTPDAYTVADEDGATIDAPGWYAVVGSEFRFFPEPTESHTGELTYVQKVPALSGTNADNWLLLAHPDAYLYGALVQFAMSKSDDRLSAWSQAYDRALAGVRSAYPRETVKAALRTDFPALFGRSYT